MFRSLMSYPVEAVVALKVEEPEHGVTASHLRQEARVLQALKEVKGVPILYGVTDSPPCALVMTFCPGIPLSNYMSSSTARTYLSALLVACSILDKMHQRGVAHGSISAEHILAAVGSLGEVTVSLVGFRQATEDADEITKKADVFRVSQLAYAMENVMTPDSDVFPRRGNLSLLLRDPGDLPRVALVLRSTLRRQDLT